MFRVLLFLIPLLLLADAVRSEEIAARGDEAPQAKGDKQMQGMSILGNDDAPKALVIVPWKSSDLADPLAVSRALDDGRQPVDRDVFMRELDYYQIRSASSAPDGAGTE